MGKHGKALSFCRTQFHVLPNQVTEFCACMHLPENDVPYQCFALSPQLSVIHAQQSTRVLAVVQRWPPHLQQSQAAFYCYGNSRLYVWCTYLQITCGSVSLLHCSADSLSGKSQRKVSCAEQCRGLYCDRSATTDLQGKYLVSFVGVQAF